MHLGNERLHLVQQDDDVDLITDILRDILHHRKESGMPQIGTLA